MTAMSQVYQTFWRQFITPDVLLVDWDTFILNFSQYLKTTISIEINPQQIEYLKSIIDPQNKNQVYKNSYLIFIQNFWDIPSNRTKFLKGQLNLSSSKIPRIKFMFALPNNSVLLTIQYLNDDKQTIKRVFEMKNNKIFGFNRQNQIINQRQVKIQSFLTLGSSQTNDICIEDCKYINKTHLKLIQVKTKKKVKQDMFSNLQKQQKFKQEVDWYLKDTSKSNRSRYCLDSPFKYVVLRSGMIIHFGLTNQYRLQVNQATPAQIQSNQIKQIKQLFQGERINYLGQIDSNIPQKSIFSISNKQVTASDIEIMYYKGQLYPQEQTKVIKKSVQLNSENQLPIKLTLFNQITLQQRKYTFMGSQVSVGRSANSSIRINLPQIRQVQCQIQCIGGVWMLKNVNQNFKSKECSNLLQITLSVSLATKHQQQYNTQSSKSKLSEVGSNLIKGRNFLIQIKVNIERQKQE